MTTTTRMFGPTTRSAANRGRTVCPLLALLAACAGCATWTTRAAPAEPVQWNPSSGARPELVLDGAWDDVTGELVISLSAVLPAGSPAPRTERCRQSAVGAAKLGVGLPVSPKDGKAKEPGFMGGGPIGPDLDPIWTGVGVAVGILAVAAVVIGIAAAQDDGEEPECSIDGAISHAPGTTSPATVAVEQFIVRVVRPDGSYLVRSASGPNFRIPLEPAPFSCPGDCLATVARRARAGWPPENEMRHERIVIEAIPQGELFGAGEPPTASGTVDVTLMP